MIFRRQLLVNLLTLSLLLPGLLAAQEPRGLRLGMSVGGTSFVALVLEHLDGHRRGLELTVGTWGFRDVSFSAAVRGYLGPSAMRPVVGAGLWVVTAPPSDEERGGVAVLARFPVGFDWRAAPGHFLDLDVNLSRALWIRRPDRSGRPLNPRLVPLPGLSYRWLP